MKSLLIYVFSLILTCFANANIVGYAIVSGSGGNPITYPIQELTPPPTGVVFISGSAVPTVDQCGLALAKSAQLKSVQSQYNAVIAAGITVTSGSLVIILAASESDRNAFNQLINLLATVPMPPSITIADINGNQVAVPVTQIYDILGKYGAQVVGLWSNLATAKASIRAAQTVEAVAAISLQHPTGV